MTLLLLETNLSSQFSAVDVTLSQMRDVEKQLKQGLSSENQTQILNSSHIGKTTLKVFFFEKKNTLLLRFY